MSDVLAQYHRANEVDLIALAHKAGHRVNTATQPATVQCPFHEDGHDFNLTVHPPGKTYRTNHYHCHACKWSGTAIDFIRDSQGISDREAVGYILERDLPPVEQRQQRTYAVRDMTAAFHDANLRLYGIQGEAARAYLESRGLGADIWETYKLGLWATDTSRWSGRITIPHLRLPGEATYAGKGRLFSSEPTDDNPRYIATRGAQQALYLGERALATDDLPIVMCEGELDTLSMAAALRGLYPVCGAPGVNNRPDFADFTGRVVILMLDDDAAGRKARDGYVDRQGRWNEGYVGALLAVNAYPIVLTPHGGDVNDMLINYGPDGLGEWLVSNVEREAVT